MSIKRLLAGFLLLMVASSALAQDEDKPSVMMLAFQPWGTVEWIEIGFVKSLISYGLLAPETAQSGAADAQENSSIVYQRLDAGGQLDLVAEVVAEAINKEPDALVTIGARITLAALLETYDMDDPPAIVFADVYNPYEAGIADAPCVKPGHLTGIVSAVNYADIVPLLLLQNADLKTIGTLHSSDDAGGAYGAAQIAEVGASLGLTVEQAAVTSLADLTLATEGLISKGVEAIFLPVDAMTMAGLPLIGAIAQDNGVLLFAASVDHMFFGALAGGGFSEFLDAGDLAGVLVATHLAGDLDLPRAGISTIQGSTVVGINQAVAESMNITLSEQLRERADFTLQPDGDDVRTELAPRMLEQFMRAAAPPIPREEREEQDRAFLTGLECTPERITEQQAELGAMDG